MDPRRFGNLICIVATVVLLPVSGLRGQDCCRADSDSVARADKLLEQVGNACDAGAVCANDRAAWAQVRRAVEMAPLDHHRLVWILQFAQWENRPDSAVAFANLARQRWPDCALSDSALVQAKGLPPQRRPH